MNPKARHALGGGLRDVKPMLCSVQADFGLEMKTVSHDARTAIINEYDVPVGRLRVECAVPHRRACRHRHPQSAFAIPQYEVRLADGHAIEGIQQHICLARPRHYLKSVSSEVRDQNVSILGEG